MIKQFQKCDIKRIALEKEAFTKRKELLKGGLNRDIKKRMVKALICSVTLYGAEMWTMRKEAFKRIEPFEMWIWRRMERISWTEHRTNEEVLKKTEEKRSLMDIIRTRQKNWIGHILRDNSLQREITEGRMEGKRGRGRYWKLKERHNIEKNGIVGHLDLPGGRSPKEERREDITCSLPLPCDTFCHTFSDSPPSPSSMAYFMDGPQRISVATLCWSEYGGLSPLLL